MKPSEFLPSFFRHAKRAVIPGQGEVDDYLNNENDPLRLPEWDYSGKGVPLAQNLLVPQGIEKPVIAPSIAGAAPPKAIIPPSIPYKTPSIAMPPEPEMSVAAPGTANYPNLPIDTARSLGHVTTSKRGRPQPLPEELDPSSEEKAVAVNRAYQTYDPEAQPAKGWRKWVPTMIAGALRGFGAGGPGGAIFGAAEGGIGGAMDPTRANREWQQKKLRETGPIVAGIQKQQSQEIKNARELAGLEGTMASTDLAKKRTLELGKPKPGQIKEDENGNWISIDPVTKTASPVMDPMTGKQAKGRPTGAKEEWIHDEEGVAHKYRDGKDTGVTDPGRKLVKVPGYGMMSPSAKYGADTTAENRDYARGRNESLDKRHDTEREQERRQRAAGIVGEVAAANAEAAKWQDLAKNSDDEEKIAEYEANFLGAKQKALAKAIELSQGYDDLYESGAGENGWAYTKPRPPKPAATPAGKAAPTTHEFSIKAYIKRNKGATAEQARAFAAANYPGFAIVD